MINPRQLLRKDVDMTQSIAQRSWNESIDGKNLPIVVMDEAESGRTNLWSGRADNEECLIMTHNDPDHC
jgi:hypothetical protein